MALVFNASGDQLTRASAFTFDGAFTKAGWVRFRDTNTYQTLAMIGSESVGAVDLCSVGCNADGTSLFAFVGQNSYAAYAETPSYASSANTWYYVVLSRSGSGNTADLRVRVWLDSATSTPASNLSFNFSSSSIALMTTLDNLTFGESDTGDPANADYLTWRIWEGVELSDAELNTERQFRTIQRTSNIWASYKFLTNTADSNGYNDDSGNGRHLTSSGLTDITDQPTTLESGTINATVTPTGVSGTGNVSSPSVSATGAGSVLLPRITGTGFVGTLTPAVVSTVSVVLSGVFSTGAVANTVPDIETIVIPDSVSAAGSVGIVTIASAQNRVVVPTGVSGTGQVGVPAVSGSATVTVFPSGVFSTGFVNAAFTFGVGAGRTVSIFGVSGVAGLGEVTRTGTGLTFESRRTGRRRFFRRF